MQIGSKKKRKNTWKKPSASERAKIIEEQKFMRLRSHRMITSGCSIEESMKRSGYRTVVLDGEEMTMGVAAKHVGTTRSTVNRRLRQGMSVAEALRVSESRIGGKLVSKQE